MKVQVDFMSIHLNDGGQLRSLFDGVGDMVKCVSLLTCSHAMETAFWEHWERQQWEDTMGFGSGGNYIYTLCRPVRVRVQQYQDICMILDDYQNGKRGRA